MGEWATVYILARFNCLQEFPFELIAMPGLAYDWSISMEAALQMLWWKGGDDGLFHLAHQLDVKTLKLETLQGS